MLSELSCNLRGEILVNISMNICLTNKCMIMFYFFRLHFASCCIPLTQEKALESSSNSSHFGNSWQASHVASASSASNDSVPLAIYNDRIGDNTRLSFGTHIHLPTCYCEQRHISLNSWKTQGLWYEDAREGNLSSTSIPLQSSSLQTSKSIFFPMEEHLASQHQIVSEPPGSHLHSKACAVTTRGRYHEVSNSAMLTDFELCLSQPQQLIDLDDFQGGCGRKPHSARHTYVDGKQVRTFIIMIF